MKGAIWAIVILAILAGAYFALNAGREPQDTDWNPQDALASWAAPATAVRIRDYASCADVAADIPAFVEPAQEVEIENLVRVAGRTVQYSCHYGQSARDRCDAMGWQRPPHASPETMHSACRDRTILGISTGVGSAESHEDALQGYPNYTLVEHPLLSDSAYENVMIIKRADSENRDWEFRMVTLHPPRSFSGNGAEVTIRRFMSLPSESPDTREDANQTSPPVPSDDAAVRALLALLEPAG